MKIALYVTAPPQHQSHYAAIQFATAIADTEHQLGQVFFSGDATYIANNLCISPQDEQDLHGRWVNIAETCQTELIICVSAGLKRGLLDQAEANRYDKNHHNVTPPFIISGLGQLIEAVNLADRLVTFKD